MTLQVGFTDLVRAGDVWSAQADRLRGAAGSLEEVDAASLGPRVAAAAAQFVDHWTTSIRRMESDSAAHGRALATVAEDFLLSDHEVSGDLGGLLPYGS